MNTELLITIALIHMAALASPGPDFALVVKLASQESRKVAISAALGIAIAIFIHTLLSLTGVSLLIKNSELFFIATQLVGSLYLAWMGVSAMKSSITNWHSKNTNESVENLTHRLTAKQGFLQGLYTNLLNPKALVFFVTLFSALITPKEQMATKIASLIILLTLSLGWFVFIATVLSKPNVQKRIKKLTPIIDLITGFIFVGVSFVIIKSLV